MREAENWRTHSCLGGYSGLALGHASSERASQQTDSFRTEKARQRAGKRKREREQELSIAKQGLAGALACGATVCYK